MDFDSDPVNLTIETNAINGSAKISVKCDEMVEGMETFDITLQLIKSDNSEVTIDKNTSMGQIIDSTGMSDA